MGLVDLGCARCVKDWNINIYQFVSEHLWDGGVIESVMPKEPCVVSDTLYGCPNCGNKSMELLEQVDGTTTFRCRVCNHEQGRGNSHCLFFGGIRVAT